MPSLSQNARCSLVVCAGRQPSGLPCDAELQGSIKSWRRDGSHCSGNWGCKVDLIISRKCPAIAGVEAWRSPSLGLKPLFMLIVGGARTLHPVHPLERRQWRRRQALPVGLTDAAAAHDLAVALQGPNSTQDPISKGGGNSVGERSQQGWRAHQAGLQSVAPVPH